MVREHILQETASTKTKMKTLRIIVTRFAKIVNETIGEQFNIKIYE